MRNKNSLSEEVISQAIRQALPLLRECEHFYSAQPLLITASDMYMSPLALVRTRQQKPGANRSDGSPRKMRAGPSSMNAMYR